MFLSGPTTRKGLSTQNLKAFILTLNDDLSSPSLIIKDIGVKNAFGGRLFTTGIDMDSDGNTDYVFAGFSSSSQPSLSSWSGGILKVWTVPDNPSNWEFDHNFLNASKQPFTAKVEVIKCFDMWYVFAGSGRYFHRADEYNENNKTDMIIGGRFLCTPSDNNCQVNFSSSDSDPEKTCRDLKQGGTNDSWNWYLNTGDEGYYHERVITDPTVSSQNIVYFTSTEPISTACGYGGRTRIWGLNCATGGPIFPKPGEGCLGYDITTAAGALYLQTSTGAINKVDPNTSFNSEDGVTSEWFAGIPPEAAPPVIPPLELRQGKILHWKEK